MDHLHGAERAGGRRVGDPRAAQQGDIHWVDVRRVGDVSESWCGLLDELMTGEEALTLEVGRRDLVVKAAGECRAEGRVGRGRGWREARGRRRSFGRRESSRPLVEGGSGGLGAVRRAGQTCRCR